MKSAHRHELQTNVLAHRVEIYVNRIRPYVPKIIGGLLALIAAMFIWSYLAGSSAAHRNEAWDSYNRAVSTLPLNIEQLRLAAEAYPGTNMQRMADVTWADGQVWLAARDYIYNRKVANEALNRAASQYQSVIQSSDDERLTGRARLGLARVFEMQNELEKAREQYGKVTGAYAKYGQQQAERLAKPDAKETYAWLAVAQPPRPMSPMGPGTPGQRPEFSPGELSLPNGTDPGAGKTENTTGAAETFDKMIKEAQEQAKANEATPNRYEAGGKPPVTDPGAPASGTDAAPGDTKGAETPPTGDATKESSAPGAPADKKAAK